MRLLACLALLSPALAQPVGNACNATSRSQSWSYSPASGALTSSSQGQCLTASQSPPADGTGLFMAPCDGSAAQAFDFLPSLRLIVARSRQDACVNLAGYGTAPGTSVWLYGCVGQGYTCQGNCDWEWGQGGALQNNESGLCLDDGYVQPLLPTCGAGAPSAHLPFCDPALPNEARAADLTSRLSLDYKLALYALPLPSLPFSALVNETLGLAALYWDVTVIHGLSSTFFLQPLRPATCFPHAIAQGASWDVDLVARIATAVAYEARVVHQMNFRASGGRAVQALVAEGGPLANSVHDPRWGRAQEVGGVGLQFFPAARQAPPPPTHTRRPHPDHCTPSRALLRADVWGRPSPPVRDGAHLHPGAAEPHQWLPAGGLHVAALSGLSRRHGPAQ